MSQVIHIPAQIYDPDLLSDRTSPVVRTDTVYVVFTTIDGTQAAVRVADGLAKAMDVPLTVVHFRIVPFALHVDQPTGISPVETAAFVERLKEDGVDARVRVFLCRDERRAFPFAFKPRSLIVIAGHSAWWRTKSERWRRALEAAGHFVVFVDTTDSSTRLARDPAARLRQSEEAFRA